MHSARYRACRYLMENAQYIWINIGRNIWLILIACVQAALSVNQFKVLRLVPSLSQLHVCMYICACVCLCVCVVCFCLRAQGSYLNSSTSGTSISERSDELKVCNWCFPGGICVLSIEQNVGNLCFVQPQVHCWKTKKSAGFWQSYYARCTKLKTWEAKIQWDMMGAKLS